MARRSMRSLCRAGALSCLGLASCAGGFAPHPDAGAPPAPPSAHAPLSALAPPSALATPSALAFPSALAPPSALTFPSPVPAPPTQPSPPAGTAGARTVVLGSSSLGRAITATVLGDPTSLRRLVVVGCIHGDEVAGIPIARRLTALVPPAGAQVWVIEDLNPDGVAAGTRQNAHGVDLNRNFPYNWAPLGPPGSQQYAGPGPLSEPESRLAFDLLNRLRPAVTIWFHQPLGLVDLSGGDSAVERRYSAMTGLPARELTRYAGSVSTWENHAFAGTTAFVVELPAGPISASGVSRYAAAALSIVS